MVDLLDFRRGQVELDEHGVSRPTVSRVDARERTTRFGISRRDRHHRRRNHSHASLAEVAAERLAEAEEKGEAKVDGDLPSQEKERRKRLCFHCSFFSLLLFH